MELHQLNVTYEELFEILNFDNITYNETQYSEQEIYVETPSGYTRIQAGVVKPKLEMLNIIFDDGTECNVAETHIFSKNGEEIFAKDADIVDAIKGYKTIISKKLIGKHDGYDINIAHPHWYYSPNGVIYHNTLMMTDFISHHIKDKKNVLLVSMEMEDREQMKRVHANALDLPINDLRNLDPLVIRNAHERFSSGGIGRFFVKDYPNGTFSPLMLDALLDSYKNELGIEFDIVYLDYLGIMKSDLISPSAGLYSYVKSIVEETRAIAKKRKIPIVSASQLNRSAVGTTSADNSAVSDSIGTVQTADFIVFLLQTDAMKEQNLITCKCTKNRFNGRTDTWNMNIDYTKMRFMDAVIQDNGMSEKEAEQIILEQQYQDFKKIKAHDAAINVQNTTTKLKDDLDLNAILGL